MEEEHKQVFLYFSPFFCGRWSEDFRSVGGREGATHQSETQGIACPTASEGPSLDLPCGQTLNVLLAPPAFLCLHPGAALVQPPLVSLSRRTCRKSPPSSLWSWGTESSCEGVGRGVGGGSGIICLVSQCIRIPVFQSPSRLFVWIWFGTFSRKVWFIRFDLFLVPSPSAPPLAGRTRRSSGPVSAPRRAFLFYKHSRERGGTAGGTAGAGVQRSREGPASNRRPESASPPARLGAGCEWAGSGDPCSSWL